MSLDLEAQKLVDCLQCFGIFCGNSNRRAALGLFSLFNFLHNWYAWRGLIVDQLAVLITIAIDHASEPIPAAANLFIAFLPKDVNGCIKPQVFGTCAQSKFNLLLLRQKVECCCLC